MGGGDPRIPILILGLVTLLLWSTTSVSGAQAIRGLDANSNSGHDDVGKGGIVDRGDVGQQQEKHDRIYHRSRGHREPLLEYEDDMDAYHAPHHDKHRKKGGGHGWMWLLVPLLVLLAVGILVILSFISVRLARMELIFTRTISRLTNKAYGKAMCVGDEGDAVGYRKKHDDLEEQQPIEQEGREGHEDPEVLRYGLYGGSMYLFDPQENPGQIEYANDAGEASGYVVPNHTNRQPRANNTVEKNINGVRRAVGADGGKSLVPANHRRLRAKSPHSHRGVPNKGPATAASKTMSEEDKRRMAAANAFKKLQHSQQNQKREQTDQKLAEASWLPPQRQPKPETPDGQAAPTAMTYQNDSIRKRSSLTPVDPHAPKKNGVLIHQSTGTQT